MAWIFSSVAVARLPRIVAIYEIEGRVTLKEVLAKASVNSLSLMGGSVIDSTNVSIVEAVQARS